MALFTEATGKFAQAATEEDLILVKTNLGGWFFDAVLKAEHTSKLTITEHPIETGASIVDHAYINPATLVLEIGMTDVAEGIVPGQYEAGGSRSVNAYKVMVELQEKRVPIYVVTRLRNYGAMLIESIVAPDDYNTYYGLKATITLKEIFIVNVYTVKLSARPQITDTTSSGQVEPDKIDASLAYQLGLGAGRNAA